MPELPEVETVRRGLLAAVKDRRILAAQIRNPGLRFPVPVTAVQEAVVDAGILAVRRRAKYLILELSSAFSLIVHLGMSGRFFVVDGGEACDKHDHIIFRLDGGEDLRFRDPRRFGLMEVHPSDDIANYHRFGHLGREPLEDGFDADYCRARSRDSIRPIKNLLMDATFVTGLGNIYVNEALFASGIHPQRAAKSLSSADWHGLIQAVRETLHEAIAQGGTTLQDEGFRNVLGTGGMFQLRLSVYGRAGEPCPRCGAALSRIVQQGRSSFVCAHCQR